MLFEPAQLRHGHGAVTAYPTEIVAHEVDDHDVLGAVLIGAEQAFPVVLGRTVTWRRSLYGRAQHAAAPLAQEQLGREARHGYGRVAEERPVSRRQPVGTLAEELDRIPRKAGLEAGADIDLEHVARTDVLDRPRDRRQVPVVAGTHDKCPELELACLRRGLTGAAPPLGKPRLESLRLLFRPQGLEPPVA